jgi:hypothetical protein
VRRRQACPVRTDATTTAVTPAVLSSAVTTVDATDAVSVVTVHQRLATPVTHAAAAVTG